MSAITIVPAASPADWDNYRRLLREFEREYGELIAYHSIEDELRDLPGPYGPPRGRMLLAFAEGELAGCVGLIAVEAEACEMRRMFVRAQWRGTGVGRALAERCLAEARVAGYKRMQLYTLPSRMGAALGLYRSLGFRHPEPPEEIPADVAFLSRVL